ncbi:MAG: carboxypeptidase regulatory-like domain-containing protein [Candidatus Competibacter sp.]|mgnify:CR=1 FL=1|nr:carboxypeptidase regulatory-like domain-containing protein [Candidatus Competibacter sp.]
MAVELTLLDLESVSASARSTDLATVLRVEYAHDATGNPTQSLTLEAPTAVRRFGRIELVHAAGWIRSPRLADAVGRAILARKARPSWTISAGIPPHVARNLMPGDDVVLSHPWIPNGTALIVDLAEEPLAPKATLTARLAAGPVPTIVITQQSAQFAPLPAGGVSVAYRDGVATLTILDETGTALVGAKVTLDRTTTRTTDAKGQAQFTTPHGTHHIEVTAAGYAPTEADITV